MKTKKIYVVTGSEGQYEDYYSFVLKAFENKDKAQEYAEQWMKDNTFTPVVDDDIWDIVDYKAFGIMDDNPEFMNEYKFGTKEYINRNKEIDKATLELYSNILKEELSISKEESDDRVIKQFEYIDNIYHDYNNPDIDEIELVCE